MDALLPWLKLIHLGGVSNNYSDLMRLSMKPLVSGESKIRKFKQIMDIGDSVNMALDLGQVEGGLIMGMGHHKSETITWDSNGKVNDLCAAYMIPTAKDLPEEWSIILTNDQSGKF